MAQAKPPDNVIHPEFNVLMHAIATCAGPAIQKLLLENPSLVQIKGWHGMTTLHRACLGGDYNVIHLLLRAGADPNVMNNNTETATHFCCKRGNPSVLHLMIEFGGDINIVDRQGRGAILHAAESGSVSMIHYLNTVCNLSLDVMDSKLQTPFHVLCVYGHMDAIKYFMKKNRCDLMKANLDGDTPLHILGREGHSHLCWLILATAGCSSLHVVNNAGFTPKDLAEQRDKMGHREINPVFEYYYKQSNRNLRPRGPVLIWYWLLLMPTVIYGSSVIVANFIGPIFHGTVIVVGLVFILYTQKKQLHRMQHVCRWPNPIYAGVFGAGIFHTFIVYYVLLLPYISRWTVLLCLTPLITALVLYLYWKVLTVDPGAVKRSCYEESLKRELTLRDLCLPIKKVTDFCVDCEIVRPRYTKHCKLCYECYLEMDHHCLFLLRCVAGRNQFYFVWFIVACLFSMFLFVTISVFHCFDFYERFSVLEIVGEMFQSNAWLFSLMIMNTFSSIWGVNILRTQFDVIANGFTNYFKPVGYDETLSVQEKCLNIVYFLFGKEPYIKNPLQNQQIDV